MKRNEDSNLYMPKEWILEKQTFYLMLKCLST